MTDVIGSLIGIVLIFFLCSPIILTVYMLNSSKIDIDHDGQDDVPYRWKNKQAGNLRRVPLTKGTAAPIFCGRLSTGLRVIVDNPGFCEKYHKAATRRA